MTTSFDSELLDKMLTTPYLPDDLIGRLRKAKSDIEKVDVPVRNELLASATVAIGDVITAVGGQPERTKAT